MYLEVDEGYPGHRKTLRLCTLMRSETADAYPPRLWAWAVRSAPDGDLTGMQPGEIEMAIRYRKQDGALFEALVTAGFIDRLPDGSVTIHGWMEHTGGALSRMSDRANRLRDKRLHDAGTCTDLCRHCAATSTRQRPECPGDIALSPVQSSPDKTRQEPPARAIPWHQDVPPRPALHPVGAATPAFRRVQEVYANKLGEHQAAAEFAHLANHHPGGRDGLADEVLKALAALRATHPYDGKPRYWPKLERFLSERLWLDEPTADKRAPAQRRDPILDAATEARAGKPYLPPETTTQASDRGPR